MSRRLITTATTVLTVLTLAACGTGSTTSAPSSSTAGASPSGSITLYSAQHEDLVKEWVDGFTADTGITVQVRQGKDASMGSQIVAEGDKSPADVFVTENSPAMTLVEKAGLLAPVEKATLEGVGTAYRPSSGAWTGIAARSTVLVYNPSKIAEADLPASLMDLQDPRYAGQWGAAAGGADFQAIVAGMLAAKGEKATADWLAGLKANAQVYQNNTATMKAVNAGEIPMGVIYHYYWYKDQAKTKEGSGNTKLHYFKGQDVGAFVSVSGGGVLKSSPKPAAAQAFLAWITGPKGQQILSTSQSMEYAVGTGSASDPALPALDSLEAPTVDPSALNGAAVIELMTNAGIL